MRNRKGQFMPATPDPKAKSANPALNAPSMTHAVVLDLGDKPQVLSLHPNVEAARAEAKRSIFHAQARIVRV